MISFCKPCLKWKFILAYKGHFGFNGFTPPHNTKYLHALGRLTHQIEDANGVVLESLFGPPQITENTFDYDRLTGIRTSSPGAFNFLDPNLLQGVYVAPQNPALEITDNHLKSVSRVPSDGVFVVNIFEWFLSNQYTLPMLEEDIEGLINSVNPDTIEWSKLRTVAHDYTFNEPVNPLMAFANNFPADVRYAPGPGTIGENWAVPDFKAAAWYLYEDTGLFHGPGQPNHYVKLVGFIEMAGEYCEKTFILNRTQQPVGSPTCVSGQGLCGIPTRINPPPFAADQHAYKMVIPNCQCQ